MGLDRLIGIRKPLDPRELKSLKPVRSPGVEAVENEDGTVVLTVPLEYTGRGFWAAVARAAKTTDSRQFELEPVGAFVWEMCDGKHTFEGISRKLRERYKMTRLESDAALGAFLQTLGRRRLITLAAAPNERKGIKK